MVKWMNKQLKEKCEALNEMLHQQDCVKEYQSLEQKLDDPQFTELEAAIKELQQQLVNLQYQGEDVTELKKQLNALHEQYFDHPLVANHAYLQEQVNQLFQYINEYINAGIRS